MMLGCLLDLPPSRRERIRVYAGHFPFVAVELMGQEFVTMTVLRDPVERTLSYHRQWKEKQRLFPSN